MHSPPIIIIEDDPDDRYLMEEIFKELETKNERVWFSNCPAALDFLQTTACHPLLILCDINMPAVDGIRFKEMINEDELLKKKSIPFIFYSTSVDKKTLDKAFTCMNVQGFFKKEENYQVFKKTIQIILNYWQVCRHPNSPDR